MAGAVAYFNENRISSMSHPFVVVELGYRSTDPSKQKLYNTYVLSTDLYDVSKAVEKGTAGITDVTIEGVTHLSRSGSIQLIDPTGDWANKLAIVGSQSNDMYGGPGPNIQLTFGWRGLIPNDSRSGGKEITSTISGFIDNMSFDVTPEGIFTANIHFMEFSYSQTSNLRFMRVQDMHFGSPKNLFKMGGGDGEKIKPQKLLELVTSSGAFSVADALKQKNIVYKFDGADVTKEIEKEKCPRIRFGDKLSDYLNAVMSLMERIDAEEQKKKGIIFSYEAYEIKSQMQTGSDLDKFYGVEKTIIAYRWKPAMTDNSNKSVSKLYDAAGVKFFVGPSFVYKTREKLKEGEKLIINWQSDLSSHTSLIHQFQDELSRKMSAYSESDWSNLEKLFDKSKLNSETDVKNGNWLATFGVDTSRAGKMFESMNELSIAQDNPKTTSQNDQIRAVILSNALKATVTVMGDPTLGSSMLPGGQTTICTNFDQMGQLISNIFNGEWLLLKVTHKFSDGKYTTDCELQGYPDMKDYPKYVSDIEADKNAETVRLKNLELQNLNAEIEYKNRSEFDPYTTHG